MLVSEQAVPFRGMELRRKAASRSRHACLPKRAEIKDFGLILWRAWQEARGIDLQIVDQL